MFTWKFIEIENKFYLFKLTQISNNQIECKLSDFEVIWSETLDANEIVTRAMHENPRIESTQPKILSAIASSTNNYHIAETGNITNEQINAIVFHIKGYISSSVPFKFYFHLKKCLQVNFLDQITIPLLKALMDAEIQKKDLIQIIRRKDLEILQYKIEGATLERKTVATQSFNEEEFAMRSINSCDLINTLQDKMNTNAILKLCKIDGNLLNSQLQYNTSERNCVSSKEVFGKNVTVISPKRMKQRARPTRKFQGKNAIKLVYDEHQSSEDDNHQQASLESTIQNDTVAVTSTSTTAIGDSSNSSKRICFNKLNL